MLSCVLGLIAFFFSLIFFVKKVPKEGFLSSIELPLIKASRTLLTNISIKFAICFLESLGCFFFKIFIKLDLDNYYSSFFFFFFPPKAFSKIPLSVAPDFVAPSPNFAIKDFSSSI